MASMEQQMREAAEAAASLVEPGMRVGLGTGRTVAWLLRALADRRVGELRCVATSPETEESARTLGIAVEPFEQLDRLDIAIDGADQVTADRWAVKGGHGAELREKIVAAAADRFIVIVSPDKLVDALHPPVPLELERFGLPATLRALRHATVRDGAPRTPTVASSRTIRARSTTRPRLRGGSIKSPESSGTACSGLSSSPR